ncbi:hypothetical protein DFS34DRAFT_387614 [Phlyctochytrium arcticum]|nr:hypothetical protein DFS34DRAFT_387614 [Phlyctochytrium arcticum]
MLLSIVESFFRRPSQLMHLLIQETWQEKWDNFFKVWQKLIYAKNESEFNLQWEKLNAIASHVPEAIDYLERNKLPFKRHWASYLVDQRTHFNRRVTSDCEGCHHTGIKNWLANSMSLLRDVFQALKSSMEYNLQRLQDTFNHDRTWSLDGSILSDEVFKALHKNISQHCQRLLALELREARRLLKVSEEEQLPLEECNQRYCSTRTVFGFACRHELARNQLFAHIPLELEDFHPHWILPHVEMDPAIYGVRYPVLGRASDRPSRSQTVEGRDSIAVERSTQQIEAAEAERRTQTSASQPPAKRQRTTARSTAGRLSKLEQIIQTQAQQLQLLVTALSNNPANAAVIGQSGATATEPTVGTGSAPPKQRCCKRCKNPLKGHPRGQCPEVSAGSASRSGERLGRSGKGTRYRCRYCSEWLTGRRGTPAAGRRR